MVNDKLLMVNRLEAMPKYEAYKDSGVEWLGEIPESWLVKRLKFLLTEINERSTTGLEELLSLSKYQGVIPKSSLKDRAGQAATLIGYKKVFKNNLVINKMQAVNGLLAVSALNGITSPDYSVYKPKDNRNLNVVFLNYLLLQPEYLSEFKRRVTGVMEGFIRLYTADLYDINIIFPPRLEQTAIANFLDQKTTQIDQAIAIKEKQISLLKERKQILIQNAVTRGLNPDAPLRDSGVEWIGEIPEHWEEDRFKFLFTQSRLPTQKNDAVVTSYRDGEVTLRSNRRISGYTEAILEHGYQGIRKGQLVLNSMDAFEGAIGVSNSDGKCTPEYVICDPNSDEYLPEYFSFLLREMALARYIQIICHAVRQRAVRIRFNNLSTRFMVVPPREEQEKIVEYIHYHQSVIDSGIALQNQQIQKLKEYKITLINSAVTGKIRIPTE